MNRRRTRLHCLTLLLTLNVAVAAADESNTLKLNLRFRVETAEDSGNFHTLTKQAHWNSKETAVVICDMWDKHWCRGATRRVGEMAPRMNEVVRALRNKGALIIHAPSSTMDHYKNTPQRKLALQAPKVETKIPLQGWCHLDKAREGDLPIDDSNGGCDCEPRCKGYAAWSSQIAAIEIGEGDAITDDAHAYYLMRQRGIKNVIVMGVHTNMCVLGRPFSIRQMIYQGQNVALVRDLTDTMYDPRSKPF
ncbi:MAG: protein-signal peptide and transmembrane prediction, partial [Planctomycetota bacterium]|nr:protein-signal peptide and transmembrane prediction [Planctomycetota bacterium]